VKKPSALYIAILTIVLFISGAFGQNPSITAKSDPKSPKETIPTTKPAKTITGENVEQDVAEALSVIEKNYINLNVPEADALGFYALTPNKLGFR